MREFCARNTPRPVQDEREFANQCLASFAHAAVVEPAMMRKPSFLQSNGHFVFQSFHNEVTYGA
jgi:hypothetical protein